MPRRYSEEEALPMHNLDARSVWMITATLRPLYPEKKDSVPTVEKAG
jgi:hypothetical protein